MPAPRRRPLALQDERGPSWDATFCSDCNAFAMAHLKRLFAAGQRASAIVDEPLPPTLIAALKEME